VKSAAGRSQGQPDGQRPCRHGSYFGPGRNRVWAQGAAKPIKLGLTCDASGQYGNSGQDDLRGIRWRSMRPTPKAGCSAQGYLDHRGHRNHAGDRQPHRRAFHHTGRLHHPDRRGAFRRRQAITQVAAKNGVITSIPIPRRPARRRELFAHQIRLGRQRHNFSKASVKNAVD
jgi:branched-chain amino acid transport system substrate-binding protein